MKSHPLKPLANDEPVLRKRIDKINELVIHCSAGYSHLEVFGEVTFSDPSFVEVASVDIALDAPVRLVSDWYQPTRNSRAANAQMRTRQKLYLNGVQIAVSTTVITSVPSSGNDYLQVWDRYIPPLALQPWKWDTNEKAYYRLTVERYLQSGTDLIARAGTSWEVRFLPHYGADRVSKPEKG